MAEDIDESETTPRSLEDFPLWLKRAKSQWQDEEMPSDEEFKAAYLAGHDVWLEHWSQPMKGSDYDDIVTMKEYTPEMIEEGWIPNPNGQGWIKDPNFVQSVVEETNPTLYETLEEAEEVRDALIENAQMEADIFGTINATDFADNLEVREIDFDTWVLYDRKHDIFYEVYVCRDCGSPTCTWGEWIPMVDAKDATHFENLKDSDVSDPETDWANAGAWLSGEDSRDAMMRAVPNRTRHRPYQNQQQRSSWVNGAKKGDANYDPIPRDESLLREDILILPYNSILDEVDFDNPANEDYEPPANYDSIQEAADAAFEHAKECAKWAIPGMEQHMDALVDAKDAAITALNVNEEALQNREHESEEEKNLLIQENTDKIEIVKQLEPENDEYESFALVQEAMDLVRQGWEALTEKDRAKALELVRQAAEKVIEAQKAAKDPDQNAFTRMAADHVAELVKAIIRANITEPEPDPNQPPPPPADPDEPAPPPPTTPDLEDLLERLTEGSETEQLVSKAKDIFDRGWIPLYDDAQSKDETDPNEMIAKDSLMDGCQALTGEIVDLVLEARDKANMRDTNDREALRLGKELAEQALNGTKQYNPDYAEQMEKILYLLELREDEKEWALWSESEKEFYRTNDNKLAKPLIFQTKEEAQDYLDDNEALTDTGDWEVMEWKGDGYEEFKQEDLPEPEWPDFKKAWDEAMTPDLTPPEIPELPDDETVPEPEKTPLDLCDQIEEKRNQQKQQQEQQQDSQPSPSPPSSSDCKECSQAAQDAAQEAQESGTTRSSLEEPVEEAISQAEKAMDSGNVTDSQDRQDMQDAIDAAQKANDLLDNYPTLQDENQERIDALQDNLDSLNPDESAAAKSLGDEWDNLTDAEKIDAMREQCEYMAEDNRDLDTPQDIREAAAMDAINEAHMATEMADPTDPQQMKNAQAAIDAAADALSNTNDDDGDYGATHNAMEEQLQEIQDLFDMKAAGETPPTQSDIDKMANDIDSALQKARSEEDAEAVGKALDALEEKANANGLDFDIDEWLQDNPRDKDGNAVDTETRESLMEMTEGSTNPTLCEEFADMAQYEADKGKSLTQANDLDTALDTLEKAQEAYENCVKYGDQTSMDDLKHMEDAYDAVGELMDALENAGMDTLQQQRFDEIEDVRDDFDLDMQMANEKWEEEGDDSDFIKSDCLNEVDDILDSLDYMGDAPLDMGPGLTQQRMDAMHDRLTEAAEQALTQDDLKKVNDTNDLLAEIADLNNLDWDNVGQPYPDDTYADSDEELAAKLAQEAQELVDSAYDLFESADPMDDVSLSMCEEACKKAREALEYTENEDVALEANGAVEKATALLNEIGEKNDLDGTLTGEPDTPEQKAWDKAREAANDYDDAASEWTEDDGKTLQSESKETVNEVMEDLNKALNEPLPLTPEQEQRQQEMKEQTMEMAEMMREAFEKSELDDEEELDALDSAIDAVNEATEDLLTLTRDEEERNEITALQEELQKMKEEIAKARFIVLGEAEKAALAAKLEEIEKRARDIAQKEVKFVNLKTGEVILSDPTQLTDRSYRRVRTYDTGSLDARSNSIVIDVTLDGIAEWVGKCCSMGVTRSGAPTTKLVIDTNDVNVTHWEDVLNKLRFFRITRLPDNSLEVTYP